MDRFLRPLGCVAFLFWFAVALTPIAVFGEDGDEVRSTSDQQAPNDDPLANARRPTTDDELRGWLENMVWHHQYSVEEIRQATGLPVAEIEAAKKRMNISPATRPEPPADRLLLLPYPGGRHPRIGFLDGAINPQRETKASVFLPWDPHDYVVLDVPEAIWSNLGLTYLAHTHIPTVWDKEGIELEPLEWERLDGGVLRLERRLPTGIVFGTQLTPTADHIDIEMWLTNGSDEELTDLRVQNCIMLKGADDFDDQTNDNKFFWTRYAACRDAAGERWIIAGCDPLHGVWGNAKCPCLHADPQFPDCAPGETTYIRGWLSFYEGPNLMEELRRIEKTGWYQ